MQFNFFKYQGTGNDFVIMDNRTGNINLTTEQVKHLCDRRFGIGADGLMLLQQAAGYDFYMKYYNADGNESTMCGNGGRCLVKFAHHQGMQRDRYSFLAIDGPHEASIEDNGWVNLKMQDVSGVKKIQGDSELNTGSPHYIKPVSGIRSLDVFAEGKAIRYSDRYKNAGINVNFVEKGGDHLFVRTYERGVENETLSCGTGVTAAALAFAGNKAGFNRVAIETLGGKLAVLFEKKNEEKFENIWLCGPAEFVFSGSIEV